MFYTTSAFNCFVINFMAHNTEALCFGLSIYPPVCLSSCLSFLPSIQNNNFKYICEYCKISISNWRENTLAARICSYMQGGSHVVTYAHNKQLIKISTKRFLANISGNTAWNSSQTGSRPCQAIMFWVVHLSVHLSGCPSLRPSMWNNNYYAPPCWASCNAGALCFWVFYPAACLAVRLSVRNNNLKYLSEYCMKSMPIWHENKVCSPLFFGITLYLITDPLQGGIMFPTESFWLFIKIMLIY